jgi:hypothetical protein
MHLLLLYHCSNYQFPTLFNFTYHNFLHHQNQYAPPLSLSKLSLPLHCLILPIVIFSNIKVSMHLLYRRQSHHFPYFILFYAPSSPSSKSICTSSSFIIVQTINFLHYLILPIPIFSIVKISMHLLYHCSNYHIPYII